MATLTCGRKFGLAVAAGTTACVLAGAARAQEIVYGNTNTPTGAFTGQIAANATTGFEAGDQILLGGVGRAITQIIVKPYNSSAANTGTTVVRFYNYPGSGTNPGTSGAPIWESGPVASTFPTGQGTVTVPVPNITVPNEFVWTAQFTTATPLGAGTALGLRTYDPPTVGSSGTFFWANNSTGFPGWANLVFQNGVSANFGCQLTAQSVVVNGACCKTDGTCTDTTNAACAALAGAVFQGTGTTCSTTTCPPPGSCCASAGVCTLTVQTACVNGGGVFGGQGSPCGTCPTQYFLDDTTGENSIGFNTESASVAWMNRFTVASGRTTVTAIEIAFGTNGAAATPTNLNGVPVTVYLWSDPNGDGSPVDGAVLASATGVVANSNTDTFNTFAIPATSVGPNGTNFFVGAIITETLTSGTGVFPARVDQSHSQGKSWLVGTTGTIAAPATAVDPANLAGAIVIDTVGLAGNWMVRADATTGPTCYANCDHSTAVPFLNVQDFSCFLGKFAAADSYANCDGSTQAPVLNVQDFSCFLGKFAANCSAP